jgi:hypothetical protein
MAGLGIVDGPDVRDPRQQPGDHRIVAEDPVLQAGDVEHRHRKAGPVHVPHRVRAGLQQLPGAVVPRKRRVAPRFEEIPAVFRLPVLAQQERRIGIAQQLQPAGLRQPQQGSVDPGEPRADLAQGIDENDPPAGIPAPAEMQLRGIQPAHRQAGEDRVLRRDRFEQAPRVGDDRIGMDFPGRERAVRLPAQVPGQQAVPRAGERRTDAGLPHRLVAGQWIETDEGDPVRVPRRPVFVGQAVVTRQRQEHAQTSTGISRDDPRIAPETTRMPPP